MILCFRTTNNFGFSEFVNELCASSTYCSDKNVTIQIGEGTEANLRRIWLEVVRSKEAIETLAGEIKKFYYGYDSVHSFVKIIGKLN